MTHIIYRGRRHIEFCLGVGEYHLDHDWNKIFTAITKGRLCWVVVVSLMCDECDIPMQVTEAFWWIPSKRAETILLRG